MAGKRRTKAVRAAVPPVEVPIDARAQAPQLPPPPPEGEAGDVLRGGKKGVCIPEPVIPNSPDALINNALCKEIAAPSPAKPGDDMVDPQVVLLDELAQGITYGTDLNHIKDDVIRVSQHQTEKADLFKVIMRGIDLNRARDFVTMRSHAEKQLLAASMRGDLKSTEYLAFLRYSNVELQQIESKLAESQPLNNNESEGLMAKVDHTKQLANHVDDERYKDTTPQGREMIRKQIYKIKTALHKEGKMKVAKPTKPANGTKRSK